MFYVVNYLFIIFVHVFYYFFFDHFGVYYNNCSMYVLQIIFFIFCVYLYVFSMHTNVHLYVTKSTEFSHIFFHIYLTVYAVEETQIFPRVSFLPCNFSST